MSLNLDSTVFVLVMCLHQFPCGSGLSIVKKIVEDHGGYIWATSREGEGTCMHIVLRKYEEVKQETKSYDVDADAPEGGRKR